ncbi:hypothetical protein KCU78_g1307, partial [Aureobasidium melanogenum]
MSTQVPDATDAAPATVLDREVFEQELKRADALVSAEPHIDRYSPDVFLQVRINIPSTIVLASTSYLSSERHSGTHFHSTNDRLAEASVITIVPIDHILGVAEDNVVGDLQMTYLLTRASRRVNEGPLSIEQFKDDMKRAWSAVRDGKGPPRIMGPTLPRVLFTVKLVNENLLPDDDGKPSKFNWKDMNFNRLFQYPHTATPKIVRERACEEGAEVTFVVEKHFWPYIEAISETYRFAGYVNKHEYRAIFPSQTCQYGLTGSDRELTKTDDKDFRREDWLTIIYIKDALPVQDNSSSPLSFLSQSNSSNQEQSQLNTSNMKATTILTTLATVLGANIDGVAATCLGSGDVFQDKGNARWHVGRACRGYDGNQGAFQGTFAPGEAKYACVQGTNTQKYEITVQNLNTGAAFDLGDGDCVLRLENEINGCDRGGESTVSGWRFRVDPNNGIC